MFAGKLAAWAVAPENRLMFFDEIGRTTVRIFSASGTFTPNYGFIGVGFQIGKLAFSDEFPSVFGSLGIGRQFYDCFFSYFHTLFV
jgi:hypothetical protein